MLSSVGRVWDEGKSWDSLMQGATLVQSHLEDLGGAIQVATKFGRGLRWRC